MVILHNRFIAMHPFLSVGTAFKNWVELWAKKGVAAISIAVEGQTDEPLVPAQPPDKFYVAHSHAGPRRQGIYGDWKESVEDQWIFQAIADTILANLLLVHGFSDVIDTAKVGLMGISWGGIVVCTVQGMILPSPVSFSHVIPAYGCGNLTVAKSPMGRGLTGNLLYPILWDPCRYLPSALSTYIPSLWMSWPEDPTFPMNCFHSTYSMMKGPVMLSIIPKLGHGHQPIWNRPESYAFSKFVWSHLDKEGKERCWCYEISCEVALPKFSVQFCSEIAFQAAKLAWSPDTDDTIAAQRKWNVSEAVTISTSDNGSKFVTTAEAILPDTCQAWMIVMTSVNQGDGELVVTSTYHKRVK